MIVMPGHDKGMLFGYLAGKYEGQLGRLMNTHGWKTPVDYLPYAVDCGTFGCFKNGTEWDESVYYKRLGQLLSCPRHPMFVVVPDAPTNAEKTLKMWDTHAERVRNFGWKTAIAVQDGMLPNDVPQEADVVFVGGTTTWKWRTASAWISAFENVHIGRVCSYEKLHRCREMGAKSVDGTGWFRNPKDTRLLIRYLEEVNNGRKQTQMEEMINESCA